MKVFFLKERIVGIKMKFFNLVSKDIGIDLGTANMLVTLKGKGIILKEPSVVAINKKNQAILATGREAKEMLGRTPDEIKAIRPLKDGVIADFTATQLMLKNVLKKVCTRYNAGRPRVVVGVPSGITEVEERAVEESIMQAGAKEVYLIEEPMAAAIGSNINVAEPTGNIIVDIGGGTTEVAVISLGGIVVSNSIRVAGDELDEDIVSYIKREMNLAIGETTAEEIKTEIGCAMPLMTELSKEIKGRDLATGLPKTINITSSQVQEAMQESIIKIVDIVKNTLEKTPPELASDIMEKGIVIAGGGALIKNIDKLLSIATGMPVIVADNPLDCVARGAGKTLDEIEKLKTVLLNSRKRR
jgi:rod shape-determining protein MreB